ncbi:MAG: flagellar biosynthesis protein FliQ [Sedimentisphaerales bacterium]|nr:flagellar biosynthesis protein FliQ [Sedimentisphaerales bacterium]MBN2843618.1 flagellar biosynthesis protein FliQ [Sedimentisphaerales bacterium]
MDEGTILDLGTRVIVLSLMISLPMLLVGLVVGVIISIIQAVTQIQEMTLTFIPKVLAMAAALIFFMPWILAQLATFATEMFGPISVP